MRTEGNEERARQGSFHLQEHMYCHKKEVSKRREHSRCGQVRVRERRGARYYTVTESFPELQSTVV